MTKTETFNLSFTANLDNRNRVTIPQPITDIIKVKKGDKVTLCLMEVHRDGKP